MGAVADGIGRVWLDTTLSNADALWPWLADDEMRSGVKREPIE